METITSLTGLDTNTLMLCLGVVFFAGIVRGFSGFALSALIMASLASFLPPVEILPMNHILEAIAGLLMVRSGFREADMRVVIGLVVGAAIGTPCGLALTVQVSVEITRLLALSTILVLAVLLFANVRPKNLDNTWKILAAGFLSGIATGLAGVGGMVVVIFVFSLGREARVIRASLVMYLFLSIVVSFFMLLFFGLFTPTVLARGAILSVPAIVGVLIGAALFSKSHEGIYRIFCLGLLIVIAVTGLLRVII